MFNRKRTKRELRAMAYVLADEIETIADSIWRSRPAYTYEQCQHLALGHMADNPKR